MADTAPQGPVLDVDIVSDVMCPWCIIGYKQLEQALAATGIGARIRWHPFELNPDMPVTGQNTSEHIQQKYGSTAEQSAAARQQMTDLGTSLGFQFNWTPDSRMWNTFLTHQVLDFALSQGVQHPLKMAFFDAHFTDQRDLSDRAVLIDVAASVGLDPVDIARVIDTGELADTVREKQQFWTSRGVSGVPSMIFAGKYLVTGAQGADNYAQILQQTLNEAA
ncbi:DsbA family oxidoreductase [Ascidiaceihabitans sp.]|uniref:DsbA family oxidoreductase n=1 Tax=Ascidiaceihabitans sp. TaxID=1872644 RepID=UPI0032977756